ncbi:MAG: putative glycogen debranching enzyme [Candidatus Angelobacter sp.]|jgi:predicted glycogen debranching enzyme|nr:putative glycogen debranching enzyme [Candidatus Angelobacter sp.]
MISIDEKICRDLNQASEREWLETNGLGGFASSTITGLNTRRYHGLLVAATQPPVGRSVLLSKLEEVLTIGDRRYELSSNQYPGIVYPQGYVYLKEFRLDPYPIFTFEVDDVRIEKHVCMINGENTTVVQYKIASKLKKGVEVRLELRPLISFRDYHATTHENSTLNPDVAIAPGLAAVTPYSGMPTLYFGHNANSVQATGEWYRRFQYEQERRRGLDYEEDLFHPGTFVFELGAKQSATVIASTEKRDATNAGEMITLESKRRIMMAKTSPLDSELSRTLALAADQFIVERGEQKTVIAGYHWFGDWGRDTMIALNGLTLATGRFDVAKSILREFSKHVSEGMLPNRFPDGDELLEYNTVDATLWYFEAIRAYYEATGDVAFIKDELYPVLVDIIDCHVRGTRYGIQVDEGSGLLHAGEPGVQLTWMDAKIGDWVVTPRIGKPVEIQALWYNALRTMEAFAPQFGEDQHRRFEGMAILASSSFNNLFWNDTDGCLYDVVNGNSDADASIRPNQVFAVSLHYSMLPIDKAKQVIDVVERELLTPIGLRTLSPKDPRYIGNYDGDQRERDSAYHQGTVWPWLMGPFVEAFLKVNANSPESRKKMSALVNGVEAHLETAGLGSVSEILEGDAPHRPCGCIAQAWSVAEILRAAKLIIQSNAEPRARGQKISKTIKPVQARAKAPLS